MSEKGLKQRFRAGEISRAEAIKEAGEWDDRLATWIFVSWIHRRGDVTQKQQPKHKKEKQLNEDGSVMRFKKGRRAGRKGGSR